MENPMHEMFSCGRFQVFFVFLTQMARFSIVWGLYVMMFGGYKPPWRCVSETNTFQNSSSDSHYSTASLMDHGNSSLTLGVGSTTSFSYNGSCKTYSSCQRIEFEPGSSTLVTEFELICDKAWIVSLIISIQMFAVMPGAYIGGQIGERFGRKVSLYSSTALLCAALVLGLFSVSWEMYSVCVALLGLGAGGVLATSVVYSMEFLDNWWRGIFGAMPIWNIALVAFSLIILFLRDWRLIHIAAAVSSGLTLLGVFWVPESLRWLYTHGKRKEVEMVVKKISKTNRLKSSVKSSVRKLFSDAQIPEDTTDQTDCQTQHTTYLDLFRDPYTRSITIKASTAWTSNLIAYISLGYGIKSLPGNFYVNAIIASVTEIPVMLILGPLNNILGRRLSTLFFFGLAAASCGTVVGVHYTLEGHVKGSVITIVAIIAKAAASTAWCGLSTMSAELYPTVVRNLGYGFLSLVSGIGGVIAPYLIPEDSSWFGVCFSIMTGMLIISMAMVLTLPETKGRDLADAIPEKELMNSAHV